MGEQPALAHYFLPYLSNDYQEQPPLETLHHLQKQQKISPDHAQNEAVTALNQIYLQIIQQQNQPKTINPFKKSAPDIKGLYLHGTPGAGKTMMMDLFFDALPTTQKMSIHFHEFMLQIHRCLSQLRKTQTQNPLVFIANEICKICNIICFDEFHVTDVADAMILKNLFNALFDHQIILIATSNFSPDLLYKNGIQRDQFLPFIDLLNQQCHVFNITAQRDYRQSGTQTPLWHLNDTKGKRNFTLKLQQAIRDLPEESSDISFPDGRILTIHARYDKIISADFQQLCESPLAANDYLYLAEHFECFFLSNIPLLHQEDRNALKRFILLIDVLYSKKKQLICLAETAIHELYQGSSHHDEFERTLSRLLEMETEQWKAQK